MKLPEFPEQKLKAGTYNRKRLPFPPAFIRNAASAVHGPAKRLRGRGPFPAEAARPGRGEIFSLRRRDPLFKNRRGCFWTGSGMACRLPEFLSQIRGEGAI